MTMVNSGLKRLSLSCEKLNQGSDRTNECQGLRHKALAYICNEAHYLELINLPLAL